LAAIPKQAAIGLAGKRIASSKIPFRRRPFLLFVVVDPGLGRAYADGPKRCCRLRPASTNPLFNRRRQSFWKRAAGFPAAVWTDQPGSWSADHARLIIEHYKARTVAILKNDKTTYGKKKGLADRGPRKGAQQKAVTR